MSENELDQRLRDLEIKMAEIKAENQAMKDKLNSVSSGIGRGLWMIGGGFIAVFVTWIAGGGLAK